MHCLRLSDEEFWGLTLAQFNALAERYIAEQKSKDYRAALICSIIAEVNRNVKKRAKPFTAEDFMPKEHRKMTAKRMKTAIKHINIMLEGEEK